MSRINFAFLMFLFPVQVIADNLLELNTLKPEDHSLHLNSKASSYLNIHELSNLTESSNTTIRINNDTVHSISIKKITKHSSHSSSYIGDVVTTKHHHPFILTRNEGTFFITFATDIKTYSFNGTDNTGNLAVTTPLNSLDFIHTEERTEGKFLDINLNGKVLHQSLDNIGNTVAEVTLLIIYTQGVESYYSGEQKTRFNHLIDVANKIFSDSGVNIRLKINHIYQIDYSHKIDIQQALESITDGEIQLMNRIEQIRYEYGADMVVFALSPEQSESNGFAWVNGSNGRLFNSIRKMYSAIKVSASSYVLAHEIGHNLGLSHSRLQSPYIGATFNFGLGYGVSKQFTTLMAYPESFSTDTRIFQFSNPDKDCFGSPCGVNQLDPHNGADAASSLNSVRFEVQNFYQDNPSLATTESILTDVQNNNLSTCFNQSDTAWLYYIGMYTSLDCSFLELYAIDSFYHLNSLYRLNLSQNQLSDLSPLKKLNKLVWLNLNANNISDISPLFHTENNWSSLYLMGNPIYCWQVRYFERYEKVFHLNLPNECDSSTDNEDFDYDGVGNMAELNGYTDPSINTQGSGEVEFENTAYSFYENEGVVKMIVLRKKGNQGRLRVDLRLLDSNSNPMTEGDELIVIQNQIEFTHGQISDSIEIIIEDDYAEGANKKYVLELISNGVTKAAIVEIIDNDHKEKHSQNSSGSIYYLLSLIFFTLKLKAHRL